MASYGATESSVHTPSEGSHRRNAISRRSFVYLGLATFGTFCLGIVLTNIVCRKQSVFLYTTKRTSGVCPEKDRKELEGDLHRSGLNGKLEQKCLGRMLRSACERQGYYTQGMGFVAASVILREKERGETGWAEVALSKWSRREKNMELCWGKGFPLYSAIQEWEEVSSGLSLHEEIDVDFPIDSKFLAMSSITCGIDLISPRWAATTDSDGEALIDIVLENGAYSYLPILTAVREIVAEKFPPEKGNLGFKLFSSAAVRAKLIEDLVKRHAGGGNEFVGKLLVKVKRMLSPWNIRKTFRNMNLIKAARKIATNERIERIE